MVRKIISGGQTGADRGALDAAMACGIETGGWCPAGRRAEDGRIPDRYALRETSSDDYAERTRANVAEADGTLVVVDGEASGGTALTIQIAGELGKPLKVVEIERLDREAIGAWLVEQSIAVLNVAGPRASESPRAYRRTFDVVRWIFSSGGAA